MPLDFQRARPLLQSGNLTQLFVEELGWEPCHKKLTLRAGEVDFAFTAIAEKRGFTAWLCASVDGGLPDHSKRLKLDRKLSETSFEHLIVFTTGDFAQQSWMWVRREPGRPLSARTHEFSRVQTGDALLQKLQLLYVSLEEEEKGELSTVTMAGRARAAFDIEHVTKEFYRDFDIQRRAFLKIIEGISEVADREWYASVMLNRLMFVYFIQRKGFLDGDPDYLRNRLHRCQQEKGKDKFYTFYRYFLLRLFHEGFGKRRQDRTPDLEKLLGNIPYLNGGLFDVHDLEKPESYGKDIHIPDKAFERVFEFFGEWQWHLDDRPLKSDSEINPDVLGYIFEKYINQKQMGAYYTKEDITEYISKNTVLPFLLDAARAKCKVAFENPNGPTVWDLLRENPDRYIYPALRHGIDKKLPSDIATGLDPSKPDLIERRKLWNKPAPAEYALPTEIWREVVARRQRYEGIRKKLAAGEVREVNDFITLNLDLRQFAQDVIANTEGPDLLRAIWHAIERVTILDPTCGSGAFLFAALNILEPLYESCLERMEGFLADDERMRTKSPEESIRELIAAGESRFLEFKSTARWNVKEGKGDKMMENVIIKTVAALLNSGGGDLLIGVQDDGNIFGIEDDLQLFSQDKRNRDAYENWLMTLLLGAFGRQHSTDLRVSFVRFGEHDVCRVTATPSATAVYVKENNQESLYVRTGNSTRSLTTSEAVAYHQQRFTNFTPASKAVENLKAHNPKKYADFRTVLENVAAHLKGRYFIFKSIILNNLFGVDIMEEAVEICKLRLFLKLAAQVDPHPEKENLGIEPLPDIDFNVRAGNSLVGYANYDEVKHAVTSTLDFDNAMETIGVAAADLQQTFDRFRQLQIEGDDSVPYADKLELRKRLAALENELNRHLAGEYGIKVGDKVAHENWVKSHQPFHWFIQFYRIITGGGFDVIIGNPPYVEYKDVKSQYQLRGYKTETCSNLFVYVLERCTRLSRNGSEVGMIIPLSAFSTDRMIPLIAHMKESSCRLSVANFSWRPGKLFDGVNLQLSILIQNIGQETGDIDTTRYLMWDSEARPELFSRIEYVRTHDNRLEGSIPKLGAVEAASILKKLRSHKKEIGGCFTNHSNNIVYYRRGGLYWKVFVDFVTGSSEEKIIHLLPEIDKYAIIAALSSDLWWWYFTITSDCRHLGNRDIQTFPFDPREMTSRQQDSLSNLGKEYVKDLKRNAVDAVRVYKGKKSVECLSFRVNQSKPIIDRIDTMLAAHYGFTSEELDFIINYDIKYRLGREAEEQDG